jgi:YD repeat-containing protein
VAVSNACGRGLAKTYDANDHLTSRTSAAKGTTGYYYDRAGNLTNIAYPVSQTITLRYDAMNRLTG